MGAAGKVSSYRPFTDVDGKDIVIDLTGGFKDIYIQVKCALGSFSSSPSLPIIRGAAPP